MRVFPIALCFLLASLTACRHSNPNIVVPKTGPNYFRNDLGQTAYVNILYTPGQQGITFTNLALLRQVMIPAGATVALGDSLLQQDKPYLLDWHSADHTVSNLSLRLPQNYKPFNYYPLISDSTEVLQGKPRPDRLYCLSGDGRATWWQSAGAYNRQGQPVWDTLMSKKYHSVYMDLVGHFYDTARLYPGQVTYSKTDLTNTHYYIADSTKFWLRANDIILTNDLRPTAPLRTTSHDSLYLVKMKPSGGGQFVYTEPYLLLVKIKTYPLK